MQNTQGTVYDVHSKKTKSRTVSLVFCSSEHPVVKLLSKRWWIPTGARLEGPKLEPKRPRAQVVLLTADQGFSSVQGILFGFYSI